MINKLRSIFIGWYRYLFTDSKALIKERTNLCKIYARDALYLKRTVSTQAGAELLMEGADVILMPRAHLKRKAVILVYGVLTLQVKKI